MHTSLQPLTFFNVLGLCFISAYLLLYSLVSSASGNYTVNGYAVAPEMQELMRFYGFGPGAYYIDRNGNYGKSGEAPSGNFNGGAPYNWTGQEPSDLMNNPYAQAYVNGVAGARVFWVYSPSIFSGATGGSSGYYHICPNNLYYTSSEGSTSVGGEYGSNAWAGVAGITNGGGRWQVQSSPNGPLLSLSGTDGQHQVPIATMLQGRWKVGQTTYAVEVGKALCQ